MHDLDTIKRLNAEATQPALDAACATITSYLSTRTRVVEFDGARYLEVFNEEDGYWQTVFTPTAPRLPAGFSTVCCSGNR